MRNKIMEGYTVKIGPPSGRTEEEVHSIYVKEYEDEDFGNMMETEWCFSEYELKNMLENGHSMFLAINGHQHPVISYRVGTGSNEKNAVLKKLAEVKQLIEDNRAQGLIQLEKLLPTLEKFI